MAAPIYIYCTNCGSRETHQPGDPAGTLCAQCGSRRELSREQRRSGVAFFLNELRAFPLSQVLTSEQRARVETHYEGELSSLRGAAPAAAAAPLFRPPPDPQHPAHAEPVFRPRPERQRPAPAAPKRQAAFVPAQPEPSRRPPREFDWGWLAEQQANLFLFAGAFLTVVAALIYVGYSGEGVSGGLKMALLSTYTLAFLATGYVCGRIKRVEMAGRVFFGVGAILVPLNFVAARTIFGDEQLSTESMWLLGSVATAAFYTAVASIGLGRVYAMAAGTALASATLAAVVITELPLEWAPAAFIALSMAMSLTSLGGPARLRERIGTVWTTQAHALAAASALVALVVALFSLEGTASKEITTGWFLPLTFAGAALYAGTHMLASRTTEAGIAAIAGFGIAFVSIIFATGAPIEYYAIILAALALTFSGAMLGISRSVDAERLPTQFDDMLRIAGVIATGAAVLFGFFLLQASEGAEATYSLETRWFVAATFAMMLPFYAVDALVRRQRLGVTGFVAAAAGALAGVVFGFGWSAEYYAFAILMPALVFGLIARFGRHHLLDRLHTSWRNDSFVLGYVGAGTAATIACAAAFASIQSEADHFAPTTYEPQFRAFLPLVWLGVVTFAAIDASRGMQVAVRAGTLSVLALGAAVTYAFDASGELYAFGFAGGAVLLATAARFTPMVSALNLHPDWREDTFLAARLGTAAATSIAIGAVYLAGGALSETYEPATRWSLPAVLVLVTLVAGVDASRGKRVGTSAAVFSGIIAMTCSVMYAIEAQPAHYGATLATTSIALALIGRVWTPSWLDERVRDFAAAAGVTASWLLFEGAYASEPRIGAAVHAAAAFFYGLAAITDRSSATLQRFIDAPRVAHVRVASGWLYASGLTAAIAFIYVLVALPDGASAYGLPLSNTFALVAFAFAGAGVATRRWRPDFRAHLYVMSLAAAVAALATGPSAGLLTVALVSYVVLYLAIAVLEDQPLVAVPSAVFGFAAVAAWRQHADAAWGTMPAAWSAIAIAATAVAVLVRDRRRAWAYGLGGAAAVYAAAAPVIGFMLLIDQVDDATGLVEGDAFYRTALYQVSTLSLAIAGVLGLVAARALGRRWIIVPASAVLLAALLLQIGSYHPSNPQAYTAVIGAYLVGLGLLGLWKFKLVPELEEAAPFVEGLGAAVIMLPSFVQSIDAGWRYQWIMLTEAMVFLGASIVLRRRGMLAAALCAMVLVAGRALVDAVNALPNWMIVAVAGSALLAIGVGILVGRERWSRWQEALMGWWDEAAADRG